MKKDYSRQQSMPVLPKDETAGRCEQAPCDDTGHVRRATKLLSCQINELAQAIDVLRSRMKPVLLESAPGDGDKAGCRECSCQIATEIAQSTDEVQCLTRQVHDLVNRLDV